MKILFSQYFKKQLKKLSKKYPQIVEDFLNKIDSLKLDQETYIGRSIYKIRIASTDMNRGKSGGFRSYLYLYQNKDLLLPLCIYCKTETASITETELKFHFDKTMEELINDNTIF